MLSFEMVTCSSRSVRHHAGTHETANNGAGERLNHGELSRDMEHHTVNCTSEINAPLYQLQMIVDMHLAASLSTSTSKIPCGLTR
jgi:hypothetical protein